MRVLRRSLKGNSANHLLGALHYSIHSKKECEGNVHNYCVCLVLQTSVLNQVVLHELSCCMRNLVSPTSPVYIYIITTYYLNFQNKIKVITWKLNFVGFKSNTEV